jgi:hypothetical protein
MTRQEAQCYQTGFGGIVLLSLALEPIESANMKCDHPESNVTADILQGDWSNHAVLWCRICGAFRVQVGLNKPNVYISPWTLPRCFDSNNQHLN